jgi:hypothetical protein
MDARYRHTQVGWAIIAIVVGLGALVVPRFPGVGGPLLPILALVLLLFGTLTVHVGQEQVRLRFGIGLVRKRIPVGEIRAWQAVRNPWYCGWGIRMGSHGWTWNVSGYDAVELVYTDGRRFCIGTDEPDALVGAIAGASGRTPVLGDAALPEPPRGPTA